MGDEVLFNRYAIALLEIAIEQNKTEEFRKEVKILKNIFQNSPEFCEILCDVNIDLAKKYSMIDKILASVNSDILSFVKVIIKNNRAHYLYKIFKDTVDTLHKSLLEAINIMRKASNAKLKIAAMINILITLMSLIIKSRTFSIIVIAVLIISLVLNIYKYFKLKFLIRKAINEFPLISAVILNIAVNNYMQSNDKYSETEIGQEDLDQLNALAAKCANYSMIIMKGLNNER